MEPALRCLRSSSSDPEFTLTGLSLPVTLAAGQKRAIYLDVCTAGWRCAASANDYVYEQRYQSTGDSGVDRNRDRGSTTQL